MDKNVRWTPYREQYVADRAPNGLSALCSRDSEYWMTQSSILFDVHVEEYHVCRVMRQFEKYQEFPIQIYHSVDAAVHKYVH